MGYSVGPKLTNLLWWLIPVRRSVYHLVNMSSQCHLDGNVDTNKKVQPWVGNNIYDRGRTPEYIEWEFSKAPGENKYYILNVGKQMYLDSNGMTLWMGKHLGDMGSKPSNLAWRL